MMQQIIFLALLMILLTDISSASEPAQVETGIYVSYFTLKL